MRPYRLSGLLTHLGYLCRRVDLRPRPSPIVGALQAAGHFVMIWLDGADRAEPTQRLREAREAGELPPGARAVFSPGQAPQEAFSGQMHRDAHCLAGGQESDWQA
jgi:hypothetical protein